jgi:hypothetical protein
MHLKHKVKVFQSKAKVLNNIALHTNISVIRSASPAYFAPCWILLRMAYLLLRYLSKLFYKQNCYQKVLYFWENSSETLTQMCLKHHVKCLIFLFDFNKMWIWLADFKINPQCKIYYNSVPWKPSNFIGTDGRKDMRKLIVAYHFASKPKVSLWRLSLQ